MFIYYRQVLRRALDEALHMIGWENQAPIWIKVYVGIFVIVVLAAVGFWDTAREQLILGLAVVVVTLAIFPIIFFWKLLFAPYLIDQELRAEIDTLNRPHQGFDETVAERLEALLNEGNQLIDRQAYLTMGESYKNWSKDLISWCRRAEDLITDSIPRDEAVGFSSASSFPNESHTGDQLREIVHNRHGKLRLIAMRYMKRAPDSGPSS